jgi:hypothetical protein
MMRTIPEPLTQPAGEAAVERLAFVAKALGVPAPSKAVTHAVSDALPFPADDARYAGNALVPGRPPFELSFVEDDRAALRFDFVPSALATPAARREQAVAIVRGWAREIASTTIPGRRSPAAKASEVADSLASLDRMKTGPRATFGAFVGAAYDDWGISDAEVDVELEGDLPRPFPDRLANVADACCSRVPGLVPHLASFSCGRERCVPCLQLRCADDVPVVRLRHALAAVGLEHRQSDLVAHTMFFGLDARVLPAGSAIVSFSLDHGQGWCKVELLARALALPRAELMRRVYDVASRQHDMRVALDRWSCAHGGAGMLPGELNVVGFRFGRASRARLRIRVSPGGWQWGRSAAGAHAAAVGA